MKNQTTTKQSKWNQRYLHKDVVEKKPVFVLENNLQLLSEINPQQQLVALDVASGLGANSIFLAKQGYSVDAVDCSQVAVEKLAAYAVNNKLSISASVVDLEVDALANEKYDVVVVSYYLQKDLFPRLFAALKPCGLLFYQTFNDVGESQTGPINKNFRLKCGELLELCKPHRLIFYREDGGLAVGENAINNEAMIVMQRAADDKS